MIQTVSCDGFRKNRSVAGGVAEEGRLLDLLVAVELNDLQMLEFLAAFRAALIASRWAIPSANWGVLKLLLASLESVFEGCDDPLRALALEVDHADSVTLHFELLRMILRG